MKIGFNHKLNIIQNNKHHLWLLRHTHTHIKVSFPIMWPRFCHLALYSVILIMNTIPTKSHLEICNV